MQTRPRIAVLLSAFAALLLIAGCSSSEKSSAPLPDGASLLKDATATTKKQQSVHLELTVTGKAIDILFRALSNGKTYGDAYVWTLADDKNGPELIQTVRRYPGGTSSAIKMERLGQIKLSVPIKGRRIKLSIRAEGGRIVTRIDGAVVATIDNDAHAHGTIGFAGKEAAAAIVHDVRISGTQSPAVAFDFAGGDNPFTGGSVAKDAIVDGDSASSASRPDGNAQVGSARRACARCEAASAGASCSSKIVAAR